MATVARVLLYLGVMVTIGDVGAQWVRRDAWTARPAPAERLRPVLAWLAVMTALLLLFVAQFLALELAPTASDVALLVRQTAWGNGWMLLAACALAGTLAAVVRAPLAVRAVIVLLTGAAMGGLGHAAADDAAPWLSRALDALHVLGVGAWLGTLFCLWRVPAPATEAARALTSWARFSGLAVAAAPLSVLSGVGSTFRRVNAATIAQMVASDYGRLLGAKIGLVLLIVALGARHRRQLQARAVPTTASVRLELLLALAVLGLTAVLTATAPPGE